MSSPTNTIHDQTMLRDNIQFWPSSSEDAAALAVEVVFGVVEFVDGFSRLPPVATATASTKLAEIARIVRALNVMLLRMVQK